MLRGRGKGWCAWRNTGAVLPRPNGAHWPCAVPPPSLCCCPATAPAAQTLAHLRDRCTPSTTTDCRRASQPAVRQDRQGACVAPAVQCAQRAAWQMLCSVETHMCSNCRCCSSPNASQCATAGTLIKAHQPTASAAPTSQQAIHVLQHPSRLRLVAAHRRLASIHAPSRQQCIPLGAGVQRQAGTRLLLLLLLWPRQRPRQLAAGCRCRLHVSTAACC